MVGVGGRSDWVLIIVSNTGAGTARDVTVTDQLPDAVGLEWTEDSDDCTIDDDDLMTCDFGDIDPGDTGR